uniref:Large ribosomal subunit protein bL33m n=1 Tax=Gopherus agassizii TaxID=38772 RepID=A0A452GQR3_9SAUR
LYASAFGHNDVSCHFRYILVRMVSAAGTGYCYNIKRARLQEKLVLLKYDPIGKNLRH